MSPFEAEEDAKRRNIAYNNQMKDENVKRNKQHENWRKFTSGKKYHYSDSLFRNGDPSYALFDHSS